MSRFAPDPASAFCVTNLSARSLTRQNYGIERVGAALKGARLVGRAGVDSAISISADFFTGQRHRVAREQQGRSARGAFQRRRCNS